ncbi:MAG TPA: glycosyltransferase 87 family protein [Candidatus Acidoferrum sp.]|nr:glycosyltransferase 87 family protein [Candidatus Acidoferrum sp.]
MRARWQRLTVAVVAAFVIAGLLVVGHQSSLARRSADFTINYSAALLIREGYPEAIYQRDQLGPLMLRLSDNAIDPRLPFDAPLALALPWVPLTFLPLELAFHVWQIVTLLVLVLALWLLARWLPLGRHSLPLAFAALLAFPASWALFSEGQSSALLLLGAVLLIGAWRHDRWWMAAAGALLLGLKPQYLPAYLILLGAQRQWRTLAAALLGALAVGLSPLLAGGVNGMVAMVWSALEAGQGVARYNDSLIGTVAPLLPGRLPTYLGFSLWAVALAALAVVASRRPRAHAIAFAALATTVAILFSPHALPYDSILLAVPAWLSFVLYRMKAIPTPAPVWMIVGLALVVDLGSPFVSLAPVALLAGLIWYGRIYRRRAQDPPTAIAA